MNDVVAILKRIGAVITNDHFVYTSGKHGEVYINKDALYPHTKETSEVCRIMAEKYKDADVEAVAAPAVGGTILSQWVAYHLSQIKGKEILSAYTEKDAGTTASAAESKQLFRRGYDAVVKGKKVLVVEDITTTGGSVKKTIHSIREAHGQIVAVCVLVNRDPKNIDSTMMEIPFIPLAEVKMQVWDAGACPLCKKNVPINTTVGKGREYLAKKQSSFSG